MQLMQSGPGQGTVNTQQGQGKKGKGKCSQGSRRKRREGERGIKETKGKGKRSQGSRRTGREGEGEDETKHSGRSGAKKLGLARTVYVRYFWQGNHQIYSHIRCIYTVLANPRETEVQGFEQFGKSR